MAQIALEVFGLFVGGLLGIIDLVLPAESPIFISDLSQGHSLLRIGIGLDKTSTESLGGTIPSIKVWNEDKVQIGQAQGSPSTYVENGTFTTVTVHHDAGYIFQQPAYLEVSGGPDAVCIAYLAQTWPDGTQLGWLGDIGKFCGAEWYYSNVFITMKNGSMHKPFCTWIGGQRPSSCTYTRKRQAASGNSSQPSSQDCTSNTEESMFTYSGFKIHTPDFGPVGTRNDFSVPDNPTELCNAPKLEWFKQEKFETSPAPRLRPFPLKSLLLRVLGILSTAITNVAGATVKELSNWTGGDMQEVPVGFRDSIVGSHDSRHSSKVLCASPTSWGPDFVSFEEGLFCDMTLRRTWPLCSERAAFLKDCYDWSSHTIVGGRRRKRAIRYSTVFEWR